ncbi:MAG: dTMP kinase [Pyrinomonadaceae bacterium]
MAETLGREVTAGVERGALICFEGLDGAGKTTIARSVAAALTAEGVPAALVERKDPDCGTHELTRRMELLKALIWEYGDAPIGELGDYHALYNMASWFSALDFRKVRPLLASGVTVVVDNWYFKFLSRFTLKKTMDEWHLRSCFAHLTRPDLVVYLDVNPEVAVARKGEFGKGETGFFDGLGLPSRENFVRYQGQVRRVMGRLASEEGWCSIEVDDKTPEQVTSLVLEAIRQRARPRA